MLRDRLMRGLVAAALLAGAAFAAAPAEAVLRCQWIDPVPFPVCYASCPLPDPEVNPRNLSETIQSALPPPCPL